MVYMVYRAGVWSTWYIGQACGLHGIYGRLVVYMVYRAGLWSTWYIGQVCGLHGI